MARESIDCCSIVGRPHAYAADLDGALRAEQLQSLPAQSTLEEEGLDWSWFSDIECLDAKGIGELIGEGPGAVREGFIQSQSRLGVFGLDLNRTRD